MTSKRADGHSDGDYSEPRFENNHLSPYLRITRESRVSGFIGSYIAALFIAGVFVLLSSSNSAPFWGWVDALVAAVIIIGIIFDIVERVQH